MDGSHSVVTALQHLYEQWAGESLTDWTALPASGSDRRYYRGKSAHRSALAVYHPDHRENQSFVAYTEHFLSKGLPVPQIYAIALEQGMYLVEDLGDQTLLAHLQAHRMGDEPSLSTIAHYRQALTQLARLQTQGVEGLDIQAHQQPAAFDESNMLWDLHYFKYCYLKPSGLAIEEALLEQDFQQLVADLHTVPTHYFMMRDCQARNIMVQGESIYFIDYQGGKYGPLAYDVASLLYQAKANLPQTVRESLLDDYLTVLESWIDLDRAAFKATFYRFVLLRSLQVLGAYGFKGLFQGKAHFIESIPYALNNVAWLLEHQLPASAYPYLSSVLRKLLRQQAITPRMEEQALVPNQLTITVKSFSYKKGLPKDDSGNGGGFVFDCRFMHNPGRYAPYKSLTGRDASVQQFLLEKSTMPEFLTQVQSMVTPAIDNYLERNFQHLAISFGCTGGQHRSVYAADRLVDFIKKHYPQVRVRLWHREQERKGWIN